MVTFFTQATHLNDKKESSFKIRRDELSGDEPWLCHWVRAFQKLGLLSGRLGRLSYKQGI